MTPLRSISRGSVMPLAGPRPPETIGPASPAAVVANDVAVGLPISPTLLPQKNTSVVVRPVMTLDPLTPLADGVLVSWALTGKALLLLLVVYPGVVALIGTRIFNRRELALPT